jgi:hypothetical protein
MKVANDKNEKEIYEYLLKNTEKRILVITEDLNFKGNEKLPYFIVDYTFNITYEFAIEVCLEKLTFDIIYIRDVYSIEVYQKILDCSLIDCEVIFIKNNFS